jgi:nucleoside 2-deoxyribosyltransferase
MKIYFAGSIRGGRDDADVYVKIINHLKRYGEVLTEHVGDKKLTHLGEHGSEDKMIHDRDLDWIFTSDVIVAEVTTPSLGIGYEIGRAIERGKKILCLHRTQDGKRLSAMIAGCPSLTLRQYNTLSEAENIIDDFFNNAATK